MSDLRVHLVGAAGIEPATLGLEIRCSIRLSYAPLTTYAMYEPAFSLVFHLSPAVL